MLKKYFARPSGRIHQVFGVELLALEGGNHILEPYLGLWPEVLSATCKVGSPWMYIFAGIPIALVGAPDCGPNAPDAELGVAEPLRAR